MLAASGKMIVILNQGPRFAEEDRAKMLRQSKKGLNDYTDYNIGSFKRLYPSLPIIKKNRPFRN